MKTKICTKCGRELPLDQFHWRDKAKGTRRSECKNCHNGFMKQAYKEKNDIVQQMKLQLKCKKCGYDRCAEALDFHHIDPSQKDDKVSKMISNNYTLDKVEEEIKKCIVLCANCHREFHALEKAQGISIEKFLDTGV